MLVMLQVTDPVERDHTMTKREGKGEVVGLKGLLSRDEEFLRTAVQALVQEALEAEMTEAIGAAKGERTEDRLSYRSGYYGRTLITRVGTLELRAPQDRAGRFEKPPSKAFAFAGVRGRHAPAMQFIQLHF